MPFSARNLESLPVTIADHHDAAPPTGNPSHRPAQSTQPAAAVTAGGTVRGASGQRWFDASQHAAKFLQVTDTESVRRSMLASKTAAFVEHLGPSVAPPLPSHGSRLTYFFSGTVGFFEPAAGDLAVESAYTRAFTLATVTGDPMMSCVYYEIDGAAPWASDARAWTGRPCRVIGRWVPTTDAVDAVQHFQCYHVRAYVREFRVNGPVRPTG